MHWFAVRVSSLALCDDDSKSTLSCVYLIIIIFIIIVMRFVFIVKCSELLPTLAVSL